MYAYTFFKLYTHASFLLFIVVSNQVIHLNSSKINIFPSNLYY